MDKFMLMLLLASGADVVAPTQVKNQQLHQLGLTGDEKFNIVDNILSRLDEPKKVAIIKGLITSHIRPSKSGELLDWVSDNTIKTLEYVKEHPDCREEVDVEEALRRLHS